MFHFKLYLYIFLTIVSWSAAASTMSTSKVPKYMLHEIYQVAKPYGFHHSYTIERSSFALIRNRAEEEDVTSGATMNSSFFTALFYLFGKVPPRYVQDIPEAMKWIRKAAFHGHSGAQCTLGIILYYGISDIVGRDRKTAFRWFYRSAYDSANPRAHWLLGRALYDGMRYEDIGVGVAPYHNYMKNKTMVVDVSMMEDTAMANHFEEVARLFRISSSIGDKNESVPESLHYLAVMYEYNYLSAEVNAKNTIDLSEDVRINTESPMYRGNMKETKTNFIVAAKLYRDAAAMGFAESLYNLALMYTHGRGVRLSYVDAANLFRQAALEHYHSPSMRYLAMFSLNGHGLPEGESDPIMAKYWLQQCVRWSDQSVAERDAERNTIGNLCMNELTEVMTLIDKSEQYTHELMRNISEMSSAYKTGRFDK